MYVPTLLQGASVRLIPLVQLIGVIAFAVFILDQIFFGGPS